MEGWVYIWVFIFVILVICRNTFLLVISLLSTEPKKYTLNYKELLLLSFSVSYFLTYLIT